jgi:hypothetical protein
MLCCYHPATFQALWTQARERTNVITIICDNGAYQILKVGAASLCGYLPHVNLAASWCETPVLWSNMLVTQPIICCHCCTWQVQ